jgi:hypothetical protein
MRLTTYSPALRSIRPSHILAVASFPTPFIEFRYLLAKAGVAKHFAQPRTAIVANYTYLRNAVDSSALLKYTGNHIEEG